MLTRTARPLFAVTVLAALIAPRVADACSPPYGFTIESSWPADGATGVPTDGVIVILGGGDIAPDELELEVLVDDVAVPGTLKPDQFGYIWRADAPLAPDTLYVVHAVSPEPENPDNPVSTLDLSFTTGAGPAPALTAGAVLSAVTEPWENTIQHCTDELGDCGQCNNWEIDAVEQRMLLKVSSTAPEGVFDGLYVGRLAVGPTVEALALPERWARQSGPGSELAWQADLGLAGSWSGDEVCFRIQFEDPTGQKVLGEPSCVDVSEINVEPPPPEPTTGEPPETDSDSDGVGGEGEKVGCECRSDASGGWSGLLALLGLGLVRPRRRR